MPPLFRNEGESDLDFSVRLASVYNTILEIPISDQWAMNTSQEDINIENEAYFVPTMLKKKRLTSFQKLKKEIIRESLENKEYLHQCSIEKKEIDNYFETVIKNCKQFDGNKIANFYKALNLRNYYGFDESDHEGNIKTLIVQLINFFIEQKDPIKEFNNFIDSVKLNLEKENTKDYKFIKLNNLEKDYFRFLNIIGGYLNKTKKYDRNSKLVRDDRFGDTSF